MNCELIREGKKAIFLNARLVDRQGLDQETVSELLQCHADLDDLIEYCNATPLEEWVETTPKKVEQLEFTMQRLWGFTEDANYHTHWLRIPYCTCPKMDNTDPVYYGRGKIISGGCPVHGGRTHIVNQKD